MNGRTLLCALVSAILVIPAPAPDSHERLAKDHQALHALNRLTFGPRPGDLETVNRTGVKKWIEQQLEPGQIVENPVLAARLEPLTTLAMTPGELTRQYPPPQLIRAFAAGRLPLPADPERRAAVQQLIERYEQRTGKFAAGETAPATQPKPQPQRVIAKELMEQKIYRAVYSNSQLAEVLTDFWFNHFNVFFDKGADRYLVTSYERDAIRPHVLGKFHELLLATSHHPAMLFYLDNWQSVSPDAVRARAARRPRGLNENYARELLELHTLGVDGGYTQKDIVEIARCFTGWTIAEPFRTAEFTFNARVHDNGEKTVLGTRIPAGGGESDGLKVLDVLARHPSTARFVSRKLAQRFVTDDPPEPLITAMSATFLKTGGDLKAVMRTLLTSREFWSDAAYGAKIKSPFEMVAGALRATGADVRTGFGLAARIGALGQPLYRKQEPTGYPNTSQEWVNSAALLGRMNFALDLLQNRLPGVRVDLSVFSEDGTGVDKRILFRDASPQTRDAIARGVAEGKDSAMIAALVLGSPDFQRR